MTSVPGVGKIRKHTELLGGSQSRITQNLELGAFGGKLSFCQAVRTAR